MKNVFVDIIDKFGEFPNIFIVFGVFVYLFEPNMAALSKLIFPVPNPILRGLGLNYDKAGILSSKSLTNCNQYKTKVMVSNQSK